MNDDIVIIIRAFTTSMTGMILFSENEKCVGKRFANFQESFVAGRLPTSQQRI